MYLIELIVGDWGGDGHEKSKSYYIYSNLSKKDIDESLKLAKNKLTFDIRDLCREYEDYGIQAKYASKLSEFNFKFDNDNIYDDGSVGLVPQTFVDIYLFSIKLGNDNFEYTLLKPDEIIHIGGYGLFN